MTIPDAGVYLMVERARLLSVFRTSFDYHVWLFVHFLPWNVRTVKKFYIIY